MRVLVELRPALDGHSGIPQEARLIFRGLGSIDGIDAIGLIQSSGRFLAAGLNFDGESGARHEQFNRLSQVVVSLQPRPDIPRGRLRSVLGLGRTLLERGVVILQSLLRRQQRLTVFEPQHFKDFIWRSFFAKTLPAGDLPQVVGARYRIAQVPYSVMHGSGLATRRMGRCSYPILDTRGIDVMLAFTPYPANVSAGTKLVIRYFDAVPLLMPHTIVNKAHHQALHYEALRHNFSNGAWFVCCSDATRRDLLSVFPEAECRAVTIHCMVSHHYFSEESPPSRVPEVLAKRRHKLTGHFLRGRDASRHEAISGADIAYLLMVSTIEPRKNHATLLEAWETLKCGSHPDLKLVIVGSLGWDHERIISRLEPWIERGQVFLLEDVPPEELRLLYRHARATVCPSYAEGFDYSGVEAMRCGGVVVASSLEVHKEVYGPAAEYFNPYSKDDAAEAIHRTISPVDSAWREARISEGASRAQRYTPETILLQWQEFFDKLP